LIEKSAGPYGLQTMRGLPSDFVCEGTAKKDRDSMNLRQRCGSWGLRFCPLSLNAAPASFLIPAVSTGMVPPLFRLPQSVARLSTLIFSSSVLFRSGSVELSYYNKTVPPIGGENSGPNSTWLRVPRNSTRNGPAIPNSSHHQRTQK